MNILQQIPHHEELDITMIQEKLGELPQEEFAEMSLCKKRFTYSTIS